MKKKIVTSVALIIAMLSLSACGNMTFLDTVWTYDRAIISLPNGEVIDAEVQEWCDYEGDQLQIKIGGKYYLVHSSDVVLISE